jgi:hypothetical protein
MGLGFCPLPCCNRLRCRHRPLPLRSLRRWARNQSTHGSQRDQSDRSDEGEVRRSHPGTRQLHSIQTARRSHQLSGRGAGSAARRRTPMSPRPRRLQPPPLPAGSPVAAPAWRGWSRLGLRFLNLVAYSGMAVLRPVELSCRCACRSLGRLCVRCFLSTKPELLKQKIGVCSRKRSSNVVSRN